MQVKESLANYLQKESEGLFGGVSKSVGSVFEGLTITMFVWLFPIIVVLVGWVLLVFAGEPEIAHTPLCFS